MNKNIYYVPTFKQEKQGKYMLYLFDEIYKKNGELYDNDMNAFVEIEDTNVTVEDIHAEFRYRAKDIQSWKNKNISHVYFSVHVYEWDDEEETYIPCDFEGGIKEESRVTGFSEDVLWCGMRVEIPRFGSILLEGEVEEEDEDEEEF